jgi:hypothetical protein
MTRPVLRLGSFDRAPAHDVADWQKLLGIKPADGRFGKDTTAATVAWQRRNKLSPDGVVGPLSWATAEGTPLPPVAPTPQASADRAAYDVAKRAAPSMTEPERQYALTVARGEGFYGLGWPQGQGAGSNNWGAVQGVGPAGSFDHIDHHADGTSYTGKFKRYATREQGFLDMASILLKPNVKAALASGNLRDAVFAQHSNGYFELDPEKYFSAVQKNYAQLAVNIPNVWKPLLSGGPSGRGAVRAGADVLLAAVGALSVYLLARKMRRRA